MLQLLILHWFQTELLRKTQWTFWSALYFWVRQALWCKCTPRTLWGGLKSYITFISFSFIVLLLNKCKSLKKKPVWTCLNFKKHTLCKHLNANACSPLLHYEMQSTIYNVNKNRHCIFSTATRGAIENISVNQLLLWPVFSFRSAIVIMQQQCEQKLDSNWIWFVL